MSRFISGGVAELEDAPDLKSVSERSEGSNPSAPTKHFGHVAQSGELSYLFCWLKYGAVA